MTKTFIAPRLYVPFDLIHEVGIQLQPNQSHYLLTVMRRRVGDSITVFNGRDGEWRAKIVTASKRVTSIQICQQVRKQESEPDVWLLFGIIKQAPLNLMIEKATELGVSTLCPVLTKHTTVRRMSVDRLQSIVLGASEQCGRMTIPEIYPVNNLEEVLLQWPTERRLFYLDESGRGVPITSGLSDNYTGPCAFLIGPEGGFDKSELDLLAGLPSSTALSLGPRILRAETAAVAALVCWQALCGDWKR